MQLISPRKKDKKVNNWLNCISHLPETCLRAISEEINLIKAIIQVQVCAVIL